MTEENSGPIDIKNFPQQQEPFLEHGLGIKGVSEDAGEIPQHSEGLCRAGKGGRGNGFGSS